MNSLETKVLKNAKKFLSCGVVIESPAGILLGHATNTHLWDIPKGRQEEKETPLETAARELEEETGIVLEQDWLDKCVDLGQHEYLREKDIHLFYLSVPLAFSLKKLRCRTFVQREGHEYPEMDQYAWVPFADIADYSGRALVGLIHQLKPKMKHLGPK